MHQVFRRLLAPAAMAAAASFTAQAHAATVIDFEGPDLGGLYLPGDSFAQAGFTLTTLFDFGVVDTAAGLGAAAPSGNATQFYFNSNDGALRLAQTGGGAFDLMGFSAAFVPLDPASAQATVIVARGTLQNDSLVSAVWQFAPSNTSSFPFTAYAGAAFSAFNNLKQVDFYACSWVGGVACGAPTQNNGQFAIDNISVSAVPEPGAALLLALGLAGLALHRRRLGAR